ncbi:hypothetical protein BDQ17DRAFT_1328870 [Cyathus striatus]|nr:hypothetical protein BDQ17DRAFT_1328870 [Cyathus striatus]
MNEATIGSEKWHYQLDRKFDTASIPEFCVQVLLRLQSREEVHEDERVIALAHVIKWAVRTSYDTGFREWDESFYQRDRKLETLELAALVEENTDLAEIVMRCWETKSFKEILEYKPFLSRKVAYEGKDEVNLFIVE